MIFPFFFSRRAARAPRPLPDGTRIHLMRGDSFVIIKGDVQIVAAESTTLIARKRDGTWP